MQSEDTSHQVNQLISALQNVTNALTKDDQKTKAPIPPVDRNEKIVFNTDSSQGKKSLRELAIILGQGVYDAMQKPINKLSNSSNVDEKETKTATTEEIVQQLKLGNTSNTKMLTQMEVMTKKPSAEEQLKQEKMVIKAPTKMVISDIDTKATKKFNGIFGKLNLFKPKINPSPGSRAETSSSSPGWLTSLMTTAGLLGMQLLDLPIRVAKHIGGAVIDGASWLGRKTIDGLRWVGGKAYDMFDSTVKMGKSSFKWLGEKYNNMRKIINLENMKKQWSNFTKWTGGKWSKFTDVVSNKWSGLSKSLTSMYGSVRQSIFNAGDAIKNSNLLKSARGLAGRVTSMFKPKGLASGMAKLSGETSSSMLSTITKMIPRGGSLLSMVGKAARFAGPIGAVVAAGVSIFNGVSAAADEYKKSGSFLAAAREGVSAAMSSLTFGLVDQETFSGMFTAIGDGLSTAGDWVGNQFQNAWDGVKNIVTGNVVDGLGNLGEMLTFGLIDNETISTALKSASDTFSKAGKWLSEGASKVWKSITGFFTNSPDVWDVFDQSGKNLSTGTQKVAKSVNNVTAASMSFEQSTKGLSEQMKQGEKQASLLAKDQKAALMSANKKNRQLNNDILDIHGIDKNILNAINNESIAFVNSVAQLLNRATSHITKAVTHLDQLDQGVSLNSIETKETRQDAESKINSTAELTRQKIEPTNVDNRLFNNITNTTPEYQLDIPPQVDQSKLLQGNLSELVRIANEQLVTMNRSIEANQQTTRELIDALKAVKNNNTVVANNNTSVINNSTSVSEISKIRTRALANM